jgi:hypothetical protein
MISKIEYIFSPQNKQGLTGAHSHHVKKHEKVKMKEQKNKAVEISFKSKCQWDSIPSKSLHR